MGQYYSSETKKNYNTTSIISAVLYSISSKAQKETVSEFYSLSLSPDPSVCNSSFVTFVHLSYVLVIETV